MERYLGRLAEMCEEDNQEPRTVKPRPPLGPIRLQPKPWMPGQYLVHGVTYPYPRNVHTTTDYVDTPDDLLLY